MQSFRSIHGRQLAAWPKDTTMLSWFTRRTPQSRFAPELYGLIVAAARQPDFYLAGGVPDTKEGRFALLVLHMTLVLERLRREGEAGAAFGQALIEAFVTDMDDNMREIGIGDLSVPRNVKKAAAALENRWDRYRGLLPLADSVGDPEQLAALLAEDLFGLAEATAEAGRFARYMGAATRALAMADAGELLAGRLPALSDFADVI
jgi:cytochrome b pre-mRNA-processing protein 3